MKAKGNQIQQPGIKNGQILSVTAQPRKERTKKNKKSGVLGSYRTSRATPSAFQVTADELVVVLRRVGRDLSPCSGGQRAQGGEPKYIQPITPPLSVVQPQVKYKHQYSNFKSH